MKTRQVQKTFLIVLASLALSGCFVFDEIQAGIDLLDEHAPVNQKPAKLTEPEQVEVAESKLPEIKAKLAEWWNNALEEEPVPADPSDGVVRCEFRGAVRFMRRSDCRLRGGLYVSR